MPSSEARRSLLPPLTPSTVVGAKGGDGEPLGTATVHWAPWSTLRPRWKKEACVDRFSSPGPTPGSVSSLLPQNCGSSPALTVYRKCVDPWLLQHHTCPHCRHNIIGNASAASVPKRHWVLPGCLVGAGTGTTGWRAADHRGTATRAWRRSGACRGSLEGQPGSELWLCHDWVPGFRLGSSASPGLGPTVS